MGVHYTVFENYRIKCISDTDTEVLAHLIASIRQEVGATAGLDTVLRTALSQVRGNSILIQPFFGWFDEVVGFHGASDRSEALLQACSSRFHRSRLRQIVA